MSKISSGMSLIVFTPDITDITQKLLPELLPKDVEPLVGKYKLQAVTSWLFRSMVYVASFSHSMAGKKTQMANAVKKMHLKS
jgi:hypothetical protein